MALEERMKGYLLVLRGTMTPVHICEGLFYGQPTAAPRFEFLTREEAQRLLKNEAFVKNILEHRCDLRPVHFTLGEPVQLVSVPQPPPPPEYVLPGDAP